MGKQKEQWTYYELSKNVISPEVAVEALTIMADKLFDYLPPGQRDIIPMALMEIRTLLKEKTRDEPEQVH